MEFSERLDQKEWMDTKTYSKEQYESCLHLLDRVGRWLGGDRATFKAFDKLNKAPGSILDVGCGGGALTMRLARKYPEAKVVGVDLAEEAIVFAKEQLKNQSPPIPNVEFRVADMMTAPIADKSYDVITSTLVMHHLSDDEIVLFLQRASQIAKEAIIINDLHRHLLGFAGYAMVSPILFPNAMIIHDGLISVRRGFIRKDWERLLSKFPKWSLSWHLPFRWIAEINLGETKV